jgi:tellurite methyltransferase
MSSSETGWSNYYKAVDNRPPHTTLVKALNSFENSEKPERFAIDLGCGNGRDSLELLRRGWSVLAIDRERAGLEQLRSQVSNEQQSRLKTRVAAFEELQDLPSCNLINASFSLPFCSPSYFGKLWEMIVGALQQNGRFAGTFFGEQDSWANNSTMTFHSKARVEKLFEVFEIEELLEANFDGKTALGESKHWHVFHVVALNH